MRKEAKGKGRLFDMPPQSQLARVFRRFLGVALTEAKIDHGSLFVADKTRLMIDWRRATRDTGCTWRAVRGDSAAKIMQSAGHKNIATTMRYIVDADGLPEGYGTPFPVLPKSLLEAPAEAQGVSVSLSVNNGEQIPVFPGVFVGAAGFEPAASSV